MGIMADRLESMVIRVSSPDRQLTGTYQRSTGVGISFHGDSYRHYSERALEHQVSRLAVLLWAGFQRGYDSAVAEATGRDVERPRESWDANRRRFRTEQAQTVAEGMSQDSLVFMRTTGMTSWQVVIRDGTLDKLGEEQFIAELVSAYRALNSDYRTKMAQLRAKHYGSGFLI